MDAGDARAAAVWAWRRAEQDLEAYEVPEVDDVAARDGRVLDRLRTDKGAARERVADLAGQHPGRRTFDVAVERDNGGMILRVPELGLVHHVQRRAGAEMARGLIATMLGLDPTSFDIVLHHRLRAAAR